MPDTPNYNEVTISGTSWVRSHKVEIFNPYNGTPYLHINEQKIVTVGEEQMVKDMGNLVVSFDVNNPLHLQVYTVLNQIYIEERDKRDNPVQEPPATV